MSYDIPTKPNRRSSPYQPTIYKPVVSRSKYVPHVGKKQLAKRANRIAKLTAKGSK